MKRAPSPPFQPPLPFPLARRGAPASDAPSAACGPARARGGTGTLPPEAFDPPLTAEGHAQAQAARAALCSEGFHEPTTVIVSPLTRAIQTALGCFGEAFAAQGGLTVCPTHSEHVFSAGDVGTPASELVRRYEALPGLRDSLRAELAEVRERARERARPHARGPRPVLTQASNRARARACALRSSRPRRAPRMCSAGGSSQRITAASSPASGAARATGRYAAAWASSAVCSRGASLRAKESWWWVIRPSSWSSLARARGWRTAACTSCASEPARASRCHCMYTCCKCQYRGRERARAKRRGSWRVRARGGAIRGA